MANNYTQFANGFEGLTPDEVGWWKAQCDEVFLAFSEVAMKDPDAVTKDWDKHWQECNYPTIKPSEVVMAAHYKEYGAIPFEIDIEEDSITLYAEESGDIEIVADLVQAFLKRFNHDDIWHLTWANTCSKARWNEFSGGAVVVTAESIEYFSADQWIYETIAKIKGGRVPEIIEPELPSPTPEELGTDLFKTVLTLEVLSDKDISRLDIADITDDAIYGGSSMNFKIESVTNLSRTQMAAELKHQGSEASFLLGEDGWRYVLRAGDQVKWVDPDGGSVIEMKIVSIHIMEQGGDPGEDIAVIDWTTLDGTTGGNLECLLKELT